MSVTGAHLDDGDLAQATAELATARELLRRAHAIVERGERREAIKTAVAKLTLTTRWISGVIERREG